MTGTNRSLKSSQWLGLLVGALFGFLLQKGGVADFDVIIAQLLMRDFTLLKIVLSAILTGMVGLAVLRSLGKATRHIKAGSLGMNVLGAGFFGIGFALLGYCPGTVAAAFGNGYLDALVGGSLGMITGVLIFAALYPGMKKKLMDIGYFGELTFTDYFKAREWVMVIVFFLGILSLLIIIETMGF